MAIDTVLVTNVSGTAWLRQADGSLLPLREGMRVPVNAEIVTDNGSTVQLQGDGMPPLTVGENREFAVSPDLAQDDVDPTEQSVSVQADPDAARVLAALQAGEDPFEVLDPTAAVITGGGDDGGSSFTRLLSIVETTVPLALEYPRPTLPERDIQRLGGRGVNNDPESLVVDGTILAQINDDSEFIDGFDVSQYFFDADNDPLTFSATGLPPGLSIDPNTGIISGTIDRSASQGGNNGVYHVVVTATDPKGGQGNIEFTWTALNPPPVAELDTETTEENTLLEVSKENGLLSNDNDPDGDDLVVTQIENENGQRVSTGTPIQGSNGGTLIVNPDGSYSFNPGTDFDYLADGETADVTFTYTISDGEGGTDTAQLVITVTGSNDAPVLVPDVYDPTDGTQVVESGVKDDGSGNPNAPFAGQNQATGNVLANDSDVDASDTLKIVSVNHVDAGTAAITSGSATIEGVYGTLVIHDDGSYTYTLRNDDEDTQRLAPGARANEEFTYTVSDGHTEVSTTLTIVVHGTNDKPVIDHTVGTEGQVTEAGIDNTGAPDAGKSVAEGTLRGTDVDEDHEGKLTWHLVDDADNVLNAASQTIETDYGQLVLNSATGQWTYTLDNTKEATQKLAFGEPHDEVFNVRVLDPEGAWDQTTITVTVTGTNDAPVIVVPGTDDATTVTEIADNAAGENATTHERTGTITFSDADGSDTHAVSFVPQGTGYLGAFDVDIDPATRTVQWNFKVEDSLLDGLAANDTLTQEYVVTIDDGKGGTVTQTVTVTIQGTNDGPTIVAGETDSAGSITELVDKHAGENTAVHTEQGKITFADVDLKDTHTAEITPVSTNASSWLGNMVIGGVNAADKTIDWTFTVGDAALNYLAEGEIVEQVYTVTITDNNGASTTQDITITIIGANDAPVMSGTVTGTVVEDAIDSAGNVSTGGKLEQADDDLIDEHTWYFSTPGTQTAPGNDGLGEFSVDGNGNWTYVLNNDDPRVQALGSGDEITDTIEVTVDDEQGGTDTKTITVTIVGTNDAPVAIADTATVVESGVKEVGNDPNEAFEGTSSVAANVLANDTDIDTPHDQLKVIKVELGANAKDVPENGQAEVVGVYGTLVIHSDGTYTYTLDNSAPATQRLNQGETATENFRYTLTDGHDEVSTSLTITITGTNDRPEISNSSIVAGEVIEAGVDAGGSPVNGKSSVAGALKGTDADAGHTEQLTWHLVENGTVLDGSEQRLETDYGELILNKQTGLWEYVLDNSKAATQALSQGEPHFESFEVRVQDPLGAWSSTQIEVTVMGTNDAPTLEAQRLDILEDQGREAPDFAGYTGTVITPDMDPDSELAVISFKIGDEVFSLDPNSSKTVDVKVNGNTIGEFTLSSDGSYTFLPKEHYSGKVPEIEFTVQEQHADGSGLTVSETLTINITPVADAPEIKVKDIRTDEDTAVKLELTAPTVVDNQDLNGAPVVGVEDAGDNPERLGIITFSFNFGNDGSGGVPVGAQILDASGASLATVGADGIVKIVIIEADGSNVHTVDALNAAQSVNSGVLLLTQAEYESLQFLPPLNDHRNVTIKIGVDSHEVDAAGYALTDIEPARTEESMLVDVWAVTDGNEVVGPKNAFELEFTNVSGTNDNKSVTTSATEDQWFVVHEPNSSSSLGLSAQMSDFDGSEKRELIISGLPSGSKVNIGGTIYNIQNGELTVSVNSLSTSPDLPRIAILPPSNFGGELMGVKITLRSQDIDTDSTIPNSEKGTQHEAIESSVTLNLLVNPDANDLTVGAVSGKEDNYIYFLENTRLTDTDSQTVDSFSFKIAEGWKIYEVTARDANGEPTEYSLISPNGDGNYVLSQTKGAQNGGATIDLDFYAKNYVALPPSHSSKDASFEVSYKTTDTVIINGQQATHTYERGEGAADGGPVDLKVEVTPVAEVVGGDSDGDKIDDLTMTKGHEYKPENQGKEDEWFDLNVSDFDLSKGWANQDSATSGGSEETFALLSPQWLDLSGGEPGVWTAAIGSQFVWDGGTAVYTGGTGVQIPVEALGSVKFKAPEHLAGKFQIKVEAHTVDKGDDPTDTPVKDTSGEAWLTGIEIAPVVDPVSLATTGARGLEDQFIALNIKPSSADPSETFNVKIDGIPTDSVVAYGDVEIWFASDGVKVRARGSDDDVPFENLENFKVDGNSLTIMNYDSLSGQPMIKPPKDSNKDFSLEVSAQAVDATPELGLSDETQEGKWAEQTISVRVKGVADDAEVELITQSDVSPITVTEAVAETDGIALSSLVKGISSTDTDGSETVSARLTGLPEGFTVVGGSIFTRGDGEAREWIIPLNADGTIPNTVKIKAPENYSGELTFQLVPVTTENDGDSNTSTAVDVTVHITPTPEATVSLESFIEEDTGGSIDFSVRQPEGENEALTAVWIKASDIDGKGFVLTIGGKTLAELAADNDVDYVSVGADEYAGFIKITGDAINQIHAKPDANFADNLGQDKLSFEFKAEITDYSNEGPNATNPVVDPVTDVIGGSHTLNVTPVTDDVKVELNNAPTTIDLAQPGSVQLDIVLTKQPDANADDEADVDGSEQFVQLLVTAPQGLLLDGMTIDGVSFNNVSYIGEGQWVLHIPADAYPTFLAQGSSDGSISATLNFTPTDFLGGADDHTVSITVVTQDAGAAGFKSDTIEWSFVSTSDGTGSGEPSSIESVTYTPKDFEAKEDEVFNLGDVFDLTVGVNKGSDDADNLHFSLVLDNVPEGAAITWTGSEGGVSITQITGDDGAERWVITGTVSGANDEAKNDALKALLGDITVELPEHWNNNASTTGGFEMDVTITGYLDNGSQKVNEPEPTIVPVTPVTDAGDISISFHALDADGNVIKDVENNPVHAQEGKPILISLDVSSPNDRGEQTLGDTLYFTLDAANGFTGDGTLTTRDGHKLELVEVSEADALTGMTPGQQYYVIKAPTDGTLTMMPVEVIYTPGPNDQYKGGEQGGTLKVKAWAEHTEPGAVNKEVATGDSELVRIDQVNNGYEFKDADGNPIPAEDGKLAVTGDENSDGKGKIDLKVSGSLIDTDDSEVVHTALLTGVPVGFLVYVGSTLAENTGTAAGGTNTWSIPLDADGKLPAGISIQPPQNWSGTLDGMQLSVISGEAALDSVVETSIDVELTVTPVADGIERMQPATAFGREGEIVELRLNLTMQDNLDASIPGAQDKSTETVSLKLSGLGTNAAFYVPNEAGEQVLVPESQIDRQADGTYVITGLTQDQANSLGFIQAQSAISTDGKIKVEAWTVDGQGDTASDPSASTPEHVFDLELRPQAAPTAGNDENLLFDGSTLLDGGAGDDTVWLRFDENIAFAEMREKNDGLLLKNIETIDLTREGFDHELTNLSVQDVLDMTDSRNELTIKADDGDVINLSDEWELKTNETESWYEATGSDSRTAKLYIKDGKTAATVTGGSNGIDSTSAMADPEFLKQIADSLKANSDGSV